MATYRGMVLLGVLLAKEELKEVSLLKAKINEEIYYFKH